MTKQHFIAFAQYIQRHESVLDLAVRMEMAQMVIAIARQDNANFDRTRFLAACGLEVK